MLYGTPALAASVDVRSRAVVRPRGDGSILISSGAVDGTFRGRMAGGGVSGEGPEPLRQLAVGVWGLLRDLGVDSGYSIEISSNVPMGSGMASSASVAASISAAIYRSLDLDPSREELLDAVYGFERIIHGRASKTGPACAVLGGVIWVDWRDGEMVAERLGSPSLPLTVGCTGRRSETKKMIGLVSTLRDRFPNQVNSIMSLMGDLVRAGRDAVSIGDVSSLGAIMNMAHGLLSSLGVSTPELDRAVWAAREAGALGAKLSGGGGGGCIVALSGSRDGRVREALEEIGLRAFEAPISVDGVVAEGEVDEI